MRPQQTELWTAEIQTPPVNQNLTPEVHRQLIDQLARLILKQIQAGPQHEPAQESPSTNNLNLPLP
jgi:hypothetical protein